MKLSLLGWPCKDIRSLISFCATVKFLQDGLFCEWAYFIDFENHKLETWKDGKKFDEISFEDLAKVGKEYMKELENRGRKEEE